MKIGNKLMIMQKPILRFIIILMFTCACCKAASQIDPLEQKFRDVISDGDINNRNDLSWLTTDQRAYLLQKAHQEQNNTDQSERNWAGNELFALGDTDILEKALDNVKAGNQVAAADIKPIVPAEMLPLVIDDVLSPTPPQYTTPNPADSDWLRGSLDNSLTEIAFSSIRNSSYYNHETRAWAQGIITYIRKANREKLSLMKNRLRLWWEHNREAVLEHRYGEATWLPETVDFSKYTPLSPPVEQSEYSRNGISRVESASSPRKIINTITSNKRSGIDRTIIIFVVVLISSAGLVALFRPKKS